MHPVYASCRCTLSKHPVYASCPCSPSVHLVLAPVRAPCIIQPCTLYMHHVHAPVQCVYEPCTLHHAPCPFTCPCTLLVVCTLPLHLTVHPALSTMHPVHAPPVYAPCTLYNVSMHPSLFPVLCHFHPLLIQSVPGPCILSCPLHQPPHGADSVMIILILLGVRASCWQPPPPPHPPPHIGLAILSRSYFDTQHVLRGFFFPGFAPINIFFSGNLDLRPLGGSLNYLPHRLNIELDLQSLFGLQCTAILIG
jgi:hypothetical protein